MFSLLSPVISPKNEEIIEIIQLANLDCGHLRYSVITLIDQEVMISGLELLIQVQREHGSGKMEVMLLGQTGEMGSRMVERMKTVL